MRRPVVLVSVHTNLIQRDLVSSGILEELSAKYDLRFLVSPVIERAELEKIGTVAAVFRGGFLRSWLWNNLAILAAIHTWTPLTGRMAREFFNRKKLDNYSPLLRLLVFANRIGIAPLLIALGRGLLGATAHGAVRGDELGRPDVIVAPTGLRDQIADDIVRWGVRKKIPTLFLQINSDVFNMKVPTAKAAYFGVWGDQSWYLARLICRYAASRLKVLGSPRFDTYERVKIAREKARRLLDLPSNGTVLLFCGATAAYDEIRALEQIEAAIDQELLPRDVTVLYKPHPRGQVKGATTAFDLARFRHIRLTPEVQYGQWGSLELYPVLFAAADAVVSPYSTMGVEGALHGLPVLCLGYHPGRFESFWAWAREYTHLQIYRHKVWAVTCHREPDFLPSLERLLKLIGDPAIASAAQNEIRSVAIRDGRRYAARLADCLDEILSEGSWRPA